MQYKIHTLQSCKSLLISLLLSTISTSALAYDITDAIDAAMKNNTELKGAAIELDKNKLEKFKAASTFLPDVSVQSTSSKEHRDGTDFRNPSRQDALIIQGEIFSGGRGIYALKTAAFSNEVAAIKYQDNVDKTILQVVQSYEQVIAMRGIFRTAVQNEETMSNILKQSEVKLSIGAITKTDMLEAKARLAAAVSGREKALADMKNAEQSFTYVVGELPPKDMTDIDIKTLGVPENFESFLDNVEKSNHNVNISEKILHIRSFNVKSAKSHLLPTITASAAVSNASAYSPPFYQQRDTSRGETYRITFALPIFRQGGADYINIKQSLFDEEAAKNIKNDTLLRAQKESAEAWNRYIQGKFAVEADNDTVAYYEEFVRGVDEEFHVGTKTLTDLLQAQVNYERAKVNLIQDKANLVASALNLKYLLGGMNTVDFSKLTTKVEKQDVKKVTQVQKKQEKSQDNKTERIATISNEESV